MIFDPFLTNVPLLTFVYPKNIFKPRFSGVFGGYGSGLLVENWLMIILVGVYVYLSLL